MLEVNNLSKSFGDVLVLDNINFVIKKGDIVSIVVCNISGVCISFWFVPPLDIVIFDTKSCTSSAIFVFAISS